MVDTLVSTVLLAIIAAASIPNLIIILIEKFNKHFGVWVCQELGFHLPPDDPEFDGVGLRGRCPRCNRLVLSDGCGGWFSLPEVDDPRHP